MKHTFEKYIWIYNCQRVHICIFQDWFTLSLIINFGTFPLNDLLIIYQILFALWLKVFMQNVFWANYVFWHLNEISFSNLICLLLNHLTSLPQKNCSIFLIFMLWFVFALWLTCYCRVKKSIFKTTTCWTV